MHVRVHLAARDGQEEEQPRARVLCDGGAVAPVGRRQDPRVPDGARVHEEVGAPEPGPRAVGALHGAAEAQTAPLGGQGDEPGRVRVLPDRADARGQISSGGEIEDRASVRLEDETGAGVGERQGVQHLRDGPGLDPSGAQETGTHRGVEEEVAHVDGRSRAPGGVLDPLDPSREHAQAASRALARDRRLDDQPRHRGDRGERLAAEAERVNVAEVLGAPDLAGRVPVKADEEVLADHSAAVVGDADAAFAAPFDRHAHDAGARVEGVLDQLLHDRGRPLDDLARRDPVGDVVRKDPDARADGGGPRRHDRRSAGESARAPRSRGTRPGRSPTAGRASSPSSRP